MISKVFVFTKLIIDSVWKLATEWQLPGLGMNFGEFMLGILVFGIVIWLVGVFFNFFGVSFFRKGGE